MAVEKPDDAARIGHVAAHARAQRLDAEEDVEGVLRAHAAAEVAQALGARAHDQRRRAELLRKIDPVIPGVGFGQGGKLAARPPVEAPAVDQRPADRHAMAAEELRRRVHDDVRAELQRAAKPGGGEGVVDHQRQPRFVRCFGNRRDVEHFEAGIAERFAEQQPRFGAQRGAERLRIARVHEGRLDPETRQGVTHGVVTAAIDRFRGDDMAAGPHQGGDGEVQRRLSARRADAPHPALERRQALLEHRHRRVADPRIEMPRALHIEQRRGGVGIREHVGRGLVDRRGARAVFGVRALPRMKRQGVEVEESGFGHRRPRLRGRRTAPPDGLQAASLRACQAPPGQRFSLWGWTRLPGAAATGPPHRSRPK